MKAKRFLKIYDFIAIVFACGTIAALLIYPYFFNNELVIDEHSGFSFSAMDDQPIGEDESGKSTAVLFNENKPGVYCTLNPGYPYPFCGLKILPSETMVKNGLDLSIYDSLTISYHYDGAPDDTLRLYIRNECKQKKSVEGKPISKVNVVEFKPSRYDSSVTISLSSFHVPRWWRLHYDISLAKSQPEFDRVVGIEFLTGTSPELGEKRLELTELKFTGKSVSKATFYLIIIVLLLLLALLTLLIRFILFYRKHKKSVLTLEELKEISHRDALTSLYNRRALDRLSEKVHQDWLENGVDYSLILCDLDDFKQVNDNFGHQFGDVVLKTVAQVLLENCRKGDIVARWGGEEFALLLPETGLKEAIVVGEHILTSLRRQVWSERMRVTASIGVAGVNSGESINDLFRRTDMGMYRSKENGKDQITVLEM